MTNAPTQPSSAAAAVKIECLCPYCGSFNAGVSGTCQTCGTHDTAVARTTAAKKPGNWYVLQARNPDAPAMTFDTLRALVAKGAVTGRSVVRGPTTGQLWRLACKVRGLSREFGHCYACGHDVRPDEGLCTGCLRIQTLPANADPAPFCEHAIEPAGELKPVAATKPLTPRKPLREDLLTVKDLAKAFQLDFGPTSAASLDELLPPKRPLLTPNRVKIGLSAAGALVVIALVGPIGMALAGRPRTPDPVPAATPSPAVAVALPAAVPTPTRVRPALFLATSDAGLRPAAVQAVAAAKPTSESPAVESPAVESPAAEPRPAPAADPAAAAVLAAHAQAAAPETDDPQQLWSAGIEAEAHGNYAAAVAAYERIESLPRTLWPTDLKARLKLARSAAREGGGNG